MSASYITLIVLFVVGQVITMGTLFVVVIFMTRERNRQQLRADNLRAEIYEQYRSFSSERDKTADTTVST
jgi:hypothetical protein